MASALLTPQTKGTALEFSVAMLQDEIRRQTKMAFARVDNQKANFEKRMKKDHVRVTTACVARPVPVLLALALLPC